MILRSVIRHFKKQEWTAIFLDFIIVVVGVGVAMAGQQWLNERQQREQLGFAEKALQGDLVSNYFSAKERLAVANCRKQAYQAIAEKLLEPGEIWTGMPRVTTQKVLKTALPDLLRSPSRTWGSRIWQAELARGTFELMDEDKRDQLDGLFMQTQHAKDLQTSIYDLQGRLKTLAVTTTIAPSDRLRYYDMLGEIDSKSSFLELIAGQIIKSIETIGINWSTEDKQQLTEILAKQNESAKTVYGNCYAPMIWPILKEALINKKETTP